MLNNKYILHILDCHFAIMIEIIILSYLLNYSVFLKKFRFLQQGSILVMVCLLFLQIDINSSVFAQETNLVDYENQNFPGIDLTLLVGIVTASSAIIAGAVTSYFNNKGNMAVQIRSDLRNKRIDVYSQLFIEMQELAIFSNRENINHDQLEKIQFQFTNWYYTKKGGLLMSKYSQRAYIDFQTKLKSILDHSNKQTEFSCDDNYIIKFLSFKFRIALIADVDVNATTLLGKNEMKEIDDQTIKAYGHLFVDEEVKYEKSYEILLEKNL